MECLKCQECIEQCMGIFSFKPHTNLMSLSTVISTILLMKELRHKAFNNVLSVSHGKYWNLGSNICRDALGA